MSRTQYKDPEIVSFYAIVIGVPSLVLLLAAFEHEWIACLILCLIILGFLFCGWPLRAEVEESGDITFIGPLRKSRISVQSLRRVKGAGLYDYRAHLILRARGGLPIGYRYRKYRNAPELAKAVMKLITESQQVHADKDAIKSLEQVAKRAK